MMMSTDSVIRDQVLIEAIKRQVSHTALKNMVERSSLSSIHRARIYAGKTGLRAEADYLGSFLPEQVAVIRGFPVYHLDESVKSAQKELLREQRNRQLGRKPLGSRFYVYQKEGHRPKRAYVVAHGLYLKGKPAFVHQGDYYVHFMSKDDHVLWYNHMSLFLEQDFRTRESFYKGDTIKQYALTKNYNSGWAFKRMPGNCGESCGDLLERKAAPLVLAAIREHLAYNGEDIDFITVRGKKEVHLEELLRDLNEQTEFKYKQVILGCCRCGQGAAPDYRLVTRLTERYLEGAPNIFMKVYTSLKLHPAFWNQALWEYFHPITEKPEEWLATMADYKDPMVEGTRKRLENKREAFEKSSRRTAFSIP